MDYPGRQCPAQSWPRWSEVRSEKAGENSLPPAGTEIVGKFEVGPREIRVRT